LLLVVEQNSGPVLMFSAGGDHVYILPEERTSDAAWCRLSVFDSAGKQMWVGLLRVDGTPTTEHVRTVAVVLAQEALAPPATAPAFPSFMHF
jgi:hypothetical protein